MCKCARCNGRGWNRDGRGIVSACVECNGDGVDHSIGEQLESLRAEVRSVLELMDGLAEQWGDEAVFRRCRDRLRKAVG